MRVLPLLTGLAASATLTGGLLLRHMVAESENLVVREIDIPIDHLPPAFDGYTITHLSDIHFGPTVRPSFIRRAVARANALGSDLIAITGDLRFGRQRGLARLIPEILGPLTAPDGVFVCLGNHDHRVGYSDTVAAVRRAGFTLLDNRHHLIERGDQRLFIIGVDDVRDGDPDLARAMQGIPPDAALILLAHEPDYADWVASDLRFRLLLAGHSHGGQIRFPLIGAPVLPRMGRRYPLGLYRIAQLWLYTNPGLGTTAWPLRLNCPPEITRITLHRRSPAAFAPAQTTPH